MIELDLNEKDGLIHLRGTKTANADRLVEVTQKDAKLIKYKISKFPKKIDGKIFSLSHNAVKKPFNHPKNQIGLKDVSIIPYSLRHTHTSYLLSKRIPIEYISKRLGHYNISITLDVYSHLLDEHKKSKVAMLEYYTLDTLLTLAFQKRCYINILNIICMERVNIFGQRIFFDHKMTQISKQ
ncbi:tyrosine-type recombinase/integrase [Staphylococcus pseudintermedius]